MCIWSGRRSQPRRPARLQPTGIPFHVEFDAPADKPHLQPLGDPLNGTRRTADAPDRWNGVASKASTVLRSRSRVETAHLSPDKRHLATALRSARFSDYGCS
jgi:hypothetical protein